jgi:hypothetical protein
MTTAAVFFQESVIRFRSEASTGKGKASGERYSECGSKAKAKSHDEVRFIRLGGDILISSIPPEN